MKHSRSFLIIVAFVLFLLVLLPGLIVQADFGSNWSVTFFNDANLGAACTANCTFTGLSAINFNWGTGVPIVNGLSVGVNPDNFSARFTSTQNFAAGDYQFVASSDDGIRVFIDGQNVLDKFTGRALTTDTFTRNMTAGAHQITVEYFDGLDQAIVQFQWFQGTGTPGATSSPIFTAVPALQFQVSGVKGLALRTGPYLGASLVSVVRPGTNYSPIARNKDEGTYNWYLITVNGKTGWASGRYLQIVGDPNAAPIQASIFEQIDGAPNVGVFAYPRSVMNFRRRPSQRATLLGQIAWGEKLDLIGRTIQGGKNFWFQVRYKGQVGWIFAPFVSTVGNINDVPIR